jgi:hypothetical protein
MAFGYSQHQRRNQLFGGEKTNRSMVFLPLGIEGDQGGGPLDVEIRGQRLGIIRYLNRNQVRLNEFDNGRMGIRNRIHLLTANSLGVMKKE